MSRRSSSPKLELVMNSTPARVDNPQVGLPDVSVSSSETMPESSCLSSDPDEDLTSVSVICPEVTPMLLVGCPRCLLYVMLSEVDPKCPQCKSTVFLDFLKQETAKWSRNRR